MTANQTATRWPEHVIGRCVTAGGATVDIVDDVSIDRPLRNDEFHRLSATCTGATCTWGDDFDARTTHHAWKVGQEPDSYYLQRLADLRTRAERHAKKCPWMPKPDGGAR